MKYLKLFEKFKTYIAYHGTPNGGFDKFDITKRGTGADINGFGDYGNGFYFTPYKKVAISFAEGLYKRGMGNKPYLYTVNLKINNPFTFEKLYLFDEAFRKKVSENNRNNRDKPEGSLLNINDEEYYQILTDLNITEEELEFMRDIENGLSDNWSDIDIAGKLKNEGYDAIIAGKNNGEIVVFDENQIQILSKKPLFVR